MCVYIELNVYIYVCVYIYDIPLFLRVWFVVRTGEERDKVSLRLAKDNSFGVPLCVMRAAKWP